MNYKLYVDKAGLPSECWIKKGNDIIFYTQKFQRRLPKVEKEYESLLRRNRIPYKEPGKNLSASSSMFLEVWDPDFYEEEDVCLPFYAYVRTDIPPYRYIGNYTGRVLTEKTCDKARDFYNYVERKVEEFQHMQALAEFAERCKRKMGEEAAAVGMQLFDFEIEDIGIGRNEFTFKFEGEVYKFVHFYDSEFVSYVSVFNLSRIEPKSILKMKVPRGLEARFIGKNGSHVKEWANMLGIRRINIVS